MEKAGREKSGQRTIRQPRRRALFAFGREAIMKRLNRHLENPAMTPVITVPPLVTVFGGSGFLGRHVVSALARRGYRIRAAVRRPDLAGHLQPLGDVGQIKPIQANVRVPWSIERALAGADGAVNLVGILYEARRQTFDAVQATAPGAIAEAAKAEGIGAVVHVSAIGADAKSDIGYARSKALGEAAILETMPDSVVFRPSIVFGPEDHFFNRFAAMARLSPVLPLIGGGHTRFQPVFVGDVAEAIARAVDGDVAPGTVYELGGPQIRSFRELMEMMLREIGRRRLLVPVPWGVARLKATFLQLLPKPLLTVDQVRQLARDNVVSEGAVKESRTLQGLGIAPHAMASILPTYLHRYRRFGQYTGPGEQQDHA
jgi:uncharacterized protein YbjT (DUF2867 family)